MSGINQKTLDEVKALLAEKIAFVPMPGGDAGGGMPPPGGDPAAMGGDPAAMGGMPPPGDPAAMGGAPMDPSMGAGMPPPGMDPAMAGGMPPPPAPAPAPASGTITMSADELFKFVKQIVALCTNNKFGGDQRPTDGGPVSDNQAVANAKLDAILNAVTSGQQLG